MILTFALLLLYTRIWCVAVGQSIMLGTWTLFFTKRSTSTNPELMETQDPVTRHNCVTCLTVHRHFQPKTIVKVSRLNYTIQFGQEINNYMGLWHLLTHILTAISGLEAHSDNFFWAFLSSLLHPQPCPSYHQHTNYPFCHLDTICKSDS